MIPLLCAIVAAALAGVLGFVADAAPESGEYVARLRVLFLGACLLGYLGVAVFVWRERKGFLRWLSLVAGLLAVRIAYFLCVNLGVIAAGWFDAAVRAAGAQNTSGLVHYALGVLVSLLASVVSLLTLGVVNNLMKKVRWAIVGLLLAGTGVMDFAHPGDRHVLPQRFGGEAPAPTSVGPDYNQVVKDSSRPVHVRVSAAGAAVRHAISPRDGWGGVIRDEMLARFRGTPEASLRERMSALEGSLLKARPELRTSPRTPRGS